MYASKKGLTHENTLEKWGEISRGTKFHSHTMFLQLQIYGE